MKTTCFALQRAHGVDCQRRTCREWVALPSHANCAVVFATESEEPMPLHDVGRLVGLAPATVKRREVRLRQYLEAAVAAVLHGTEE